MGNTRKNKKQNKKFSVGRWLWTRAKFAVKFVVAIVLLAIVVVGILFYKNYGSHILNMKSEATQLVANCNYETFMGEDSSKVYDVNGNMMPIFTTEEETGYIEYEDIPAYAVDAMVATEDRDFYEHKGIDFSATMKAVYELIKNEGAVKRGGSTITQQLAKNIFLTNEVSWQRKMEEMFIATSLEKKYEKYEIMEFYLNNIYFANGYYGIEDASRGYFSCSVGDLSLSQIAFLCAIPNSPTRYDPVVDINATLERRDRVLKQMFENNCISEEEYNQALAEKISLNMRKKSEKKVSNYVVTYVGYCAVRSLMEAQGFEFKSEFENDEEKHLYEEDYNELYALCQQQLYSKGYKIYTSIDTKKQTKLQNAVDDNLKGFKELKSDGVYNMQASAVCIDNSNGLVSAIVGGRSQDITGYGLNRAYQSYRQPGSAIKPILVYATAFENGYTPDSKVVDEPIENGPDNAGGNYAGEVTIRTAVEKSINTISWKLYEELIPHNCLKHLVDMGFKKITYEDDYLAASLGGVSYGASALEMASAYAALENDGKYISPTCILRIEDSQGNVVIDNNIKKKVIYEENASRMMTDVLTSVMESGTAKGYGVRGISCAGKTGTTNEKKDGWFVGYTRYYTTAVWVGCDNPKSIEGLKGNTYPLYIWNEYMNDIHKGLKDKKFKKYEQVVAELQD